MPTQWPTRRSSRYAHPPARHRDPSCSSLRGDQRAPNRFASELLRTAALEDRAVLYRHDLFYPTTPLSFQSTTLAKEGHAFHQALGQLAWQPIVIGAHQQAAQFLASDGAMM